MLTIVVNIQVKPGREAEFEAVATELFATARKAEPGAVFYHAFRAETPGLYVMIECFEDEKALQLHRETAHFQKARPKLAELWVGAPSVQRLVELTA